MTAIRGRSPTRRSRRWRQPIVVDGNAIVVAGHTRREAAKLLGLDTVPVHVARDLTAEQARRYRIADNRVAEETDWDEAMLALELTDMAEAGLDLVSLGFDDDQLERLLNFDPDAVAGTEAGTKSDPENRAGNLLAKFGVAPFTVLNAREGWWQDRKRAWLDIGIKSELGRGGELLGFSSAAASFGRIRSGLTFGELPTNPGMGQLLQGTSIFDPVLCEVAYRWFSPAGGVVLDPFSGGSVRGVVASRLGRRYVGVDLRAEQVEANKGQLDIAGDPAPDWRVGDSRDIAALCGDVEADFIFSCPPYADLEVYSEDPLDLSTLKYDDFRRAYAEIIEGACSLLKEDRFACFVVGDVRGPDGCYYNFVGDTVEAFRAAGLSYYNEAILVTAVGSLPIRVGRQFSVGRKLGKTHQNVLVFVKGDPRRAVEALGDCEFGELPGEPGQGQDQNAGFVVDDAA